MHQAKHAADDRYGDENGRVKLQCLTAINTLRLYANLYQLGFCLLLLSGHRILIPAVHNVDAGQFTVALARCWSVRAD